MSYRDIYKKSQKRKFFTPPSPEHVFAIVGICVVGWMFSKIERAKIENEEAEKQYIACTTGLASHAELTALTINGTPYQGKVTPLEGREVDGLKAVEFEMHIDGADEIIDIDEVDFYNLKISYRVGDKVTLLSVPRRASWQVCNTRVWIRKMSAAPAAAQPIKFTYPY